MSLYKKTYSELLLDPRWQKKRLDILNRDNFHCCYCFDEGETLHVHHLSYEGKKLPWEVSDESLVTACKSCHSMLEDIKKKGYEYVNHFTVNPYEPKEIGVVITLNDNKYLIIWRDGEEYLVIPGFVMEKACSFFIDKKTE